MIAKFSALAYPRPNNFAGAFAPARRPEPAECARDF
jgi:hypothetical protein